MSRFTEALVLLPLALGALACASSGVDLDEPRRVLGREADVRVDAQIFNERIGPGSGIRMTWEIENMRGDAIAVADLVPAISYDATERTFVIHLGSEVPGNELLPRLILIAPGERKTFTGSVKVNLHLPRPGPLTSYPRFLKVRVNFLSDTGPFAELIAIPESSVYDPDLADRLFPQWIEANETVATNAIPIQWTGVSTAPDLTKRRF